jgi:hypothetical protein
MDKSKFHQKRNILKNAAIVLKQQFFGVDEVIDQLIESVRSWYHFPNFQTRPLVINLWGMTGVGKSELVRELVKVLGFENRFYQFDCGELGHRQGLGIRHSLSKISNFREVTPSVIFLDEFQMNRTIDEKGKEVQNTESRILWKLLDDGEIEFEDFLSMVEDRFFEVYEEFSFWLKSGLKVENGLADPSFIEFLQDLNKVKLSKGDLFEEVIEKDSNRFFFKEEDIDLFFPILKNKFNSKSQFKSFLKTLNEVGVQNLLNECMEIVVRPKTVDFSLALIIVAGNLDEAYWFSKDSTADLSPDDFHKQSLKIKLPEIKKALQSRYRVEQISRLGNNHIIFPSLNSKAFKKIITTELAKIKQQVYLVSGVSIEFETSVSQWLFDEGVTPTQGVRPLLSSIRYSIGDLIPKILERYYDQREEAELVVVSISNGMNVTYLLADQVIHQEVFPVTTKIKKLKENRGDDFQSLVAVHESGHAIVQIALTGKIPEKIFSVTSDKSIGGIMQSGIEKKYYTYNLLLEEVAITLAGFYAETVVFGENNVSNGSSKDIEIATELTFKLFKESGFGGSIHKFSMYSDEYENSFHEIKEVEKLAVEFIQKAGNNANEIIKREMTLLLEMAKVLSDLPAIGSEEIKKLVELYGTSELNPLPDSGNNNLRKLLFEKAEKISALS